MVSLALRGLMSMTKPSGEIAAAAVDSAGAVDAAGVCIVDAQPLSNAMLAKVMAVRVLNVMKVSVGFGLNEYVVARGNI